jgi:hypothetical protein
MGTMLERTSTHMTDADYDRERERLRVLYGNSAAEAAALRDQALALLFHRSGWTQERLAAKEGVTRQSMDYRLRFGRFLEFATTVAKPENLPKGVTERKFRALWEQTEKDGNERVRFQAVLKMIRENVTLVVPKRKNVREKVIASFGDGKWHELEAIVTKIDVASEEIEQAMASMHECKWEKKKYGTSWKYRIFPQDKTVSLIELTEKLAPIVKELKVEGKKSMAAASPACVAILASRLQKLLDEWTEPLRSRSSGTGDRGVPRISSLDEEDV